MRKTAILTVVPLFFLLCGAGALGISFGLGDTALEMSLFDIGASAATNIVGFQAEVSFAWGQSPLNIQLALNQGLLPAEVYLAAALAFYSHKPLTIVIEMYQKNKVKGWGSLAKALGIKPGSKEFKALKAKAAGSSEKLRKNKNK